MSNFSPSYSDSPQPQQLSAASSNSGATAPSAAAQNDDPSKKKKTTKRRKVNHACLYCRRSHMTCDEGRPCQRCIKREIGHLCHDERRPKVTDKQPSNPVGGMEMSRSFAPVPLYQPTLASQPANSAWSMGVQQQGQFLYQPETLGNEFSVLTDFLETLDEGSFFTPPASSLTPALMSPPSYSNSTLAQSHQHQQHQGPTGLVQQPSFGSPDGIHRSADSTNVGSRGSATDPRRAESSAPIVLASATKTERFLLTAADQESGSRNERLNRVIRSKYEAGLLKPYNYVKGYARLSRWMDRNVSQESKQQILQPLSVLRPKFRAVAQSLRDLDLVFIEEAFERLLLDYDRVFSAMGVPACLWRRTGEIYKGNREFTELVGVDGYMMRDGRLCIYELMAEESAVNYWEKYGHVAFDSSQKAVLTSCVLRYKPLLNSGSSSPGSLKSKRQDEPPNEEGFINCCFSFTIRRDKWGIPTMIVGNFIKC